MTYSDEHQPNDSNLPTPDPTRMTTQLVDRALTAFRVVMETRLNAIDRATELLGREMEREAASAEVLRDRLRQEQIREMAVEREFILSKLANVADVGRERFSAIDNRFVERDVRAEQAAQESRISLAAALAAQKEAVAEQNKANTAAIAKSETATVKQIDAVVSALAASTKTLDDKIAGLMTRIDRGEGGSLSLQQARTQSNWSTGVILAVAVSVGTALVSLATTVVIAIVNHH
jgi:hypothetical protein